MQQILVYTMGMSPTMKALILMVFRIWDSVIDPLMGWISDIELEENQAEGVFI